MVQNLITTVPTGTHQFPARNHRPTRLRQNVVSQCHNQSNFDFIVHGEQHFPYLRNLFEPKSLIIITHHEIVFSFPFGDYDHAPRMGGWLTDIWNCPSNRTNRRISVFFKGHAYNEPFSKWRNPLP